MEDGVEQRDSCQWVNSELICSHTVPYLSWWDHFEIRGRLPAINADSRNDNLRCWSGELGPVDDPCSSLSGGETAIGKEG